MNNNQNPINPMDALTNSIEEDAKAFEQLRHEAEQKANEIRKEKGIPEKDSTQEAQGERDPEEYDLFKVVVDAIMKVMQDPAIQEAFISLRDKFTRISAGGGDVDSADISRELIEVVSMSISYSVIMSIEFYDQRLKHALSKDFGTINEVFTKVESDLMATTMKVLAMEKQLAGLIPKEAPEQ